MLTRLLLASFGSALMLIGTACVQDNEPGDAPDETTETRSQALVSLFAAEPNNQTIDEGQTANINIGTLCVDSNATAVEVTIDWGDGNTDPRTLTSFDLDTAGVVCAAGDYVVCDETSTFAQDPGCVGWTNQYADNPAPPATAYTATMTAAQGTSTSTQTVSVTVNNLAPVIDQVSRTGAGFEGIDGTFTLVAGDPGLSGSEIASVDWVWTPQADVQAPETVTCDCTAATNCTDNTTLAICGESTEGTLSDQKNKRYLDDGVYTLTVTVTDKDGASTTETLNTTINNSPPSNVNVRIDNSPISVDSGNPTVLLEGQTFDIDGIVSEDGTDQLDFNWDLGDGLLRTGTGQVTKADYPAIVNLNPTDILSYTHAYNTSGTSDVDFTVLFDVTDDDGGSASSVGYVRISDVDPIIDSFTPSSTTVTEGSTVTFTVDAKAGDSNSGFDDIDTYDWRSGTTGLEIADEIQIVSGCTSGDTTCELRFLDGGPATYDIFVDVNDEDSTTTSNPITITVNNENPTVDSVTLNAPTVVEGGSVTLAYQFSDPAGALDGDYTTTITWGDGDSDTETVTAPGNTNDFTHTYADNEACPAGICTITVETCEVGSTTNCGTETETIPVLNVAPSPSIAPFGQLVEGVPFTLDGSFTDPAGALDQNYNWAWIGTDGTGLTGSTDYANRDTNVDVANGGIFEEDTNSASISLNVTDASGETGTATINNVQVRDNVPIIDSITPAFATGTDEPADINVDVNVAAETDSDLVQEIEVDWGDGDVSTNTLTTPVDSTGGTFNFVKPGPYIDSGTYTITVTVTDEDSSVTDTLDVTIDNVAPVIDLVETTPAQPVIVTEGQSLAARITASDASTVDAQSLDFEIDWGDGTTDFVTGSGTGTPGEARARFSHAYTNPSPQYTVTITVTDKDGGVDTSTFTVEVLNRAPSITDTFNTGPVDENTEVTAVMLIDNPGSDSLTYSFNFNCTQTSQAAVSDADFSDAVPGSGTSAIDSFTYEQDGSYPVCVRVCDDDGPNFGCDYGLTTVQVNNVAPTITSFASPAAVDEATGGVSVSLSATANDPGPSDTLSYRWDCESDGTDDATTTTGSTTCTYATSGVYTATLVVEDGDGGNDIATTQVRVRNAAPTISAVSGLDVDEGNATTVTVTAADPGGDALTYRWDFDGDGAFDREKQTNAATYMYNEDGSKTVSVEVCDGDGACAQDTTTLLVSNVAPTISSLNAPSSLSRGSAVTVSASANDAGGDALTYQFDFKDSSGTTIFSIGPQSSPIASGTIDTPGNYTVDVTVTDTAGAPNSALTDTESASFSVTDINVAVNVVANPASIDEGGTTTITVTPQGTGPYLVRYDINGDGDFGDPEDIVPASASDTCDGTNCSATVTYDDNRPGDLPFRVLVEVTDTGEADAIATALVSITVRNTPPTIAAIADDMIEEESTLSLTISASDAAGADDPITYSLVAGSPDITVDPNSGALSWTPGWEDEGANLITVRATDDDGASSDETFTVTVTIIDTNNNGVSDTRERALNNGNLLPSDAGTVDTDNDGVSDLDEVLAGTDPTESDAPSAPLVLSPDAEAVDALRPTLTVVNATSPRGLDLEYTFVVEDDTGTEVTRITGVEEGVSTTSADVDLDLTEDSSYTWFAFANDGLVDGENSEDGEFTVNTTNSAPPAPETLTPVDGAELPATSLVSLELRAVVDPDGDTVHYEFEIADSDTFDNIVLQSELRQVPFYAVAEVLPPGVYYWRGQATDGVDVSGFGASSSFTVLAPTVGNTPPTAPTIESPTGVVSAATTLEIGASTDAEGDTLEYQFELADNAAFADADSSGFQSGLTYDVSGLAEDTTYFWRARAFDGSLTSDWVSARFTVDAENNAPEGLELVTPASGALLESAPEALVWRGATDPDGDDLTYTVELATSDDFETPFFSGSGTELDNGLFVAELTDVEFNPALSYFWRVTVSDGENEVSETASFDIFDASAVGGASEDDGCGCATLQKPAERQPWALVIGLGLLGLVIGRRRRMRRG